MSVNNVTSTAAIYQSLLQAINPNNGIADSNDYSDAALLAALPAAGTGTSTATTSATTQPTLQDIQTLLQKLAGSQPTLLDYLNSDTNSQADTESSLLNFNYQDAALKAFSNSDLNADSNSNFGYNSDSSSSDPLFSRHQS